MFHNILSVFQFIFVAIVKSNLQKDSCLMVLEGESIMTACRYHGNRPTEILTAIYIRGQERGNWKWVKSIHSQIPPLPEICISSNKSYVLIVHNLSKLQHQLHKNMSSGTGGHFSLKMSKGWRSGLVIKTLAFLTQDMDLFSITHGSPQLSAILILEDAPMGLMGTKKTHGKHTYM